MGDLTFNVYNIIILIGCVQGLLLSLLLIRNSAFRKKSNSYLALMMLSFSVSNFYQLMIDLGPGKKYPVIFFMPLNWSLLIPFAFYFFIRYLIPPSRVSAKEYYWMLSPFLIHVLFQVTALSLSLLKSPVLYNHFEAYHNIKIGFEFASICYSIIIILTVYRNLVQYERKLRDNFSALNNKTLGWLRNLVLALSILWIFWSLPYLYEVITGNFLQWHHYPLWIGMSVVVYWIGYSTYSRSDIFQAPAFAIETALPPTPKLSDKIEEHYQRLLEVMKIKKPYLNPELSLEMLANEINLSAGYLSSIINKMEKMRFYDFINKYRVEEAKKMIGTPAFGHYSIIAIGFEAGFNSKSTFNAAFKKHSGITPSGYKIKIGPVS